MVLLRNISLGAHYLRNDTGMIERLTGCELTYSIPDSSDIIRSEWEDGSRFEGKYWQELYTCSSDSEPLVNVADGHSAVIGKSIVFRKKVGKGEVIILGSVPSAEDMRRIIRLAAEDAGIECTDADDGITLIPRKGEHTEGLMVVSYKNKSGCVTLPEPMTDLLSGKEYSGKAVIKPYDLLILQKT